ncbi:MAG: beta-propeller domain-containing protein [Methanobacteriota archaeon]|nr:MAG: beta-propeller domain-containing protein [Euryarchaeota archaeon]
MNLKRAPVENVGRNSRMMSRKMKAVVLTSILVLSVFVASMALLAMDKGDQDNVDPDMPYFPTYDGFLYTIPSMNLQTEACQQGELVTTLPIGDIQRFAELEEEQDFGNKHPFGSAYGGYYGSGTQFMTTGTYDDTSIISALPEMSRSPAPRDIEEADIVKLVGDTFYILNPYRGLLIFSVENPDEPVLLGRAAVYGIPQEMYIVDDMAYLVENTNYGYWYDMIALEGISEVCDFSIGSQIVVVDVSDSANPQIVEKFQVPGFIEDTRRVGKIIYAVSNEFAWYGRGYNETEDKTYVISFDISNPEDIKEVQRIEFGGRYNQIHVTQTAMYVAQPTEGNDWNETAGTRIVYLDISHPGGQMTIRGSFDVGGSLNNRYQMDYYDGTLRVVTHYFRRVQESELWILDVSNPSNMELLGRLLVDDAGSLMATRFAGDRAYTIHLPVRVPVDPLDVLDLSDPTDPKLTDILEIPGWVTHMEVRGYKILALGVDDSSGRQKVALSLFDVSDPYNAVLLDRVAIGEEWSWSSANADPKTLSVLDDLNMVLVPFNTVSAERDMWSYWISGVQIIDFDLSSGDLVTRGLVKTPASVSRTRYHSERILATSDRALQVIEYEDRDNPEVTAVVELAQNVIDYFRISECFVRLVSSDWSSTLRLETLSVDPPGGVAASIDTKFYSATVHIDEPYLYLVGYNYETYKRSVKIFDYSDPLNPEFKGVYVLTNPWGYITFDIGMGIMPGSWGGGEVLFGDDYLVQYYSTYDWEPEYKTRHFIELVDLSDPSNPTLITKYEFDATYVRNMILVDDVLYFTDIEYVQKEDENGTYRYETNDYLGRIALVQLWFPIQLPSLSIPGVMLDVEGSRAYTLAGFEWGDDSLQTLNVLELGVNEITLKAAIRVDGYVGGVIIEDGIAYLSNSTDYYYRWAYPEVEIEYYFIVMDLRDTDNPTVAGKFELNTYAHLWKVEEGHAFLTSYMGCVFIFDVTDPTSPTFFGIYHTISWVNQIRVYDNMAYFVEGFSGVEVVDLS